ncbi:hypothetical protein M5K25_001467 [Dendrobium thyrsiflorum]|uniref:Uncharacterized protein n=1 Tax=Dendrobium thyrsiflorum TaxID=117978 RepID=A0ABD0VRI9_DENTH
MVNRRSSRIVGASRSNSHQSRNQSMNHRQPISASFYPGGQNVAGEGTSGPSLEERIRKMEESHNEILQLLRETRQPTLPQREEVLLPRDPPGIEEVQPEHLQAKIHLPPPRRHPRSLQDNELVDTASSTHPSHTDQQPRIPQDLPEDLAQPYVAELPHNTLRRELRRLRGPGPEQGMPPVQGQGKASTEIEGGRKANAVGRFNPQFELPNGFQVGRAYSRIERLDETNPTSPRSLNSDIIKTSKCPSNAVHSNHSEITPDLSLIYEPCHSQKSINRALISPRRGAEGNRRRRRRRRREEKKERREETPPRPPPDFQVTPEFCLNSKRGQNSARLPSNARILSNSEVTPEFCPTLK